MHWTADRQSALAHLAEFAPHAGPGYTQRRNFDDGAARANVSRLSPWLHAGLLSEGEAIAAALDHHRRAECDAFVAEVFWRVYFKGYLEQRPSIWADYCAGRDAAFARLEADDARAEAYARACDGRTGIAAFDHWARELVQTHYLHNHARMWFASIWIFTLRLDWELGADFFLRHLLDGDAASNTLSWRWVGGLHTKGKTYLARPDNIARFTEAHPDGPLGAGGLAAHAEPLAERRDHPRAALDLPSAPVEWPGEPYALLLHEEAAYPSLPSSIPADIPTPGLVLHAARPEARSSRPISAEVAHFARAACASGAEHAAARFGCPMREWAEGERLDTLLAEAGLAHVASPFLCAGWSRDTLEPELAPLRAQGRVTTWVSDLERATWPHARAGFFKVKKAIPAILEELGLGDAGSGLE